MDMIQGWTVETKYERECKVMHDVIRLGAAKACKKYGRNKIMIALHILRAVMKVI